MEIEWCWICLERIRWRMGFPAKIEIADFPEAGAGSRTVIMGSGSTQDPSRFLEKLSSCFYPMGSKFAAPVVGISGQRCEVIRELVTSWRTHTLRAFVLFLPSVSGFWLVFTFFWIVGVNKARCFKIIHNAASGINGRWTFMRVPRSTYCSTSEADINA